MEFDGCERCGALETRPAGPLRRLRIWFGSGSGLRGIRVCARCGAFRGQGTWLYRRASRWFGIPRAWRELRWLRRWHPVPAFYTAVGAIAAVVGVATALLLGVRAPWLWAGVAAVGAGVVVFALSVGTLFRDGGGMRKLRSLFEGPRSSHHDVEGQIRSIRTLAAGRAVLVPDGSWSGSVAISGFGVRDPDGRAVLSSLGVTASDGPEPESRPSVRVEHRWDEAPLDVVRGQAVGAVVAAEQPPGPTFASDLDPRRRADRAVMEAALDDRRRRQAARERELSTRWHEGLVPVDGATIPADLLEGDDAGAAVFADGDAVVEVVWAGRRPDPLALAHTTDLEPLLDAMRIRYAG